MIHLFNKDRILKLVKFLPPFLILVGSMKLMLFYSQFGIRIVDYLELTEVLISFMDNAITFLFLILLPIIVILSFWGRAIGTENQKIYEAKAELSFAKRLKIDLKENYVLIFVSTLYLIVFLVKSKWDMQNFFLLISFPGFYIIYFIIREIRISYKKQYDYSIPVTYLNLFNFIYLFLNIVVQTTLWDAKQIKEYHKYYGTEIYLEKEVIKCDSGITFIGQTKNYLFIHDISKERNIIIPKAKVEKLIIVQK